jgi:hypothetical protein
MYYRGPGFLLLPSSFFLTLPSVSSTEIPVDTQSNRKRIILKFRCETLVEETNHESVLTLSKAAFWEVIRALQSNLNIYYSPQPAAPHL